jgi:hypothetical protein
LPIYSRYQAEIRAGLLRNKELQETVLHSMQLSINASISIHSNRFGDLDERGTFPQGSLLIGHVLENENLALTAK